MTSTGWRIVGAPAVSLLSATNALDATPGDDADVVFAAQFRVRPRTGTQALDPLLRALDAGIAPVKTGDGVIARQSRFTEPASRFHSIVWRTAERNSVWIGELSWRRVHPAIAGVAITDHFVIEERPGDLRLTLRTFARGGADALRGHVGAGQARSPLLGHVAAATRLMFNGRAAEARILTPPDVDAFIRDVLLDERREHAVAVLTATESGEYYVEPTDLAAELLGVADVFYLDQHRTSFSLTDGIGDKRLSAFWGALRVYKPGFTCADDGTSHPLLLVDRLTDPVVRTGLLGGLALANRSRVAAPASVDDLLAPPPVPVSGAVPIIAQPVAAAVAEPATTYTLTPSPTTGVLPPALSTGLESSIRLLAEQLAAFQRANVALMDEIARLRTTAAVRAANASNVDRRLADLERMIRDFTNPPATIVALSADPAAAPVNDDAPEISLASVVREAMATQSDALLVLEQAVKSAEESPYVEVDRVATILDAMAFIARRRQADAMGQSLRDTFREFGIDYRGGITRGTSARHKRQYIAHLPGGDVLCEEHIALGTSQDPRHCLRIYFTSRAPGEPRFVIAHVGRHFDVASTT